MRLVRGSALPMLMLLGIACGGDDKLVNDGGATGGDGGTSEGDASSDTDGGKGSDSDGGDAGSRELSLEVTDVITSTYEDCIEPTVAEPVALESTGQLYFEATTGSDTAPPEDWTVGSDCTAGDEGLVCTGINPEVLTYTGTGMVAAISFDVVHTDSASVSLNVLGNPSESVTTESRRVAFVASIAPNTALTRTTNYGGTLTLSNLEVTRVPAPASAVAQNNTRTIFTLLDRAVDDSVSSVRGTPYVASFEVPTDGEYAVGSLCTEKSEGEFDTCQSLPACTLYDDAGVEVSDLGFDAYEWDPTVDPEDPTDPFENPDAIQRAVSPQELTAGTYHILCEQPGRVFVRTYDASLIRSCNYLTWYFSLRQGGEAVTGLDVSSITPTVDGRDLGVEAGAALTQNNTSRVSLLLDRSYSITQAMATDAVKEAAKAFVDAMPEGTFYQVHQFASEDTVPLTIEGQPTSDTEAVKSSLDAYDPWPVSNSQGFTKLFDGIGRNTVGGYNRVNGPFPPPNFDFLQKVMIVFTDGEDTASTIFVDDQGNPDASLVVNQLQVCRVKALSVGLGSGIEEDTLRSLTGDSFFLAADNESLLTTFQAVADDLNSRYRFKMVTPQPVVISDGSTLRIDLDGESVTATYEPPTKECVLHDTRPVDFFYSDPYTEE